eukprot:scaffold2069_cov77-Skeletonema_dohrnii-CCMP3373.AAC.8
MASVGSISLRACSQWLVIARTLENLIVGAEMKRAIVGSRINRSLRELPPRGSWHAKIWIGRGMYRGNYLYRRHKHEPRWIGLPLMFSCDVIEDMHPSSLISQPHLDQPTTTKSCNMVRNCLQGLLSEDVSDAKRRTILIIKLTGKKIDAYHIVLQDAPLEARSMCKVQNY